MDPVHDDRTIISAKVKILQPNKVALVLCPFDDGLYMQKGAPRLRMIGETLHEGCITVLAGMQASHIGVHGIVRYRKVRFENRYICISPKLFI